MLSKESKRCGLFPSTFFRGLVLISLIAVLILPLYTIFFISPSFVDFIIRSHEELAIDVAIHMESKLIPDQSPQLTRDILTPLVLRRISTTADDFNLLKVRIMFPDGEIFFSSQPQEVGQFIASDEFKRTVALGQHYVHVITKGEKTTEGFVMAGDIVETYVPILREGKTIGVFEIYYDITRKKEELNHLLHILYWTVFPLTFVLFCAVVLSCRRANKNIARRIAAEEELMTRGEELREKNEELTELVIVCKERQRRLEEEEKARQQAQEQVQQEMLKREKMRIDLLRHMVRTQEEERARIARELHDETAQTLTAASLNFATLQNLLAANPEMSGVVGRLQGLCKQMHQDLYRLVHDLRPAQLDDLGLVPALRYLVDEGQKNTGLKVTLSISGTPRKLEPFVETIIYRFVQEGLTNVTRYAETDRASVFLIYEEQQVIARVEDKGKGFDPAKLQQSGSGWGLIGISERAQSLKGVFTIIAAPGEGTVLEIAVPLTVASCPLNSLIGE
ncbi:MAG: sensor histidine kinase [Deltaproteobacteria bacterium]|nr:sensor histidine kinase [Deltaproteobacteria bacterium]